MDDIVFATGRLRSRRREAADESWYVAAIDGDIRRFTRMPNDIDSAAWFAQDALDPPSDSASAAVVLANGTIVGNVGARAGDDRVDLSYWIDAMHRGHGYATEALGALTEWAQRSLGDATLELEITPDNQGSIAVAERNGYAMHGLRSSCSWCADASGNVAVYRMTRGSIPSPTDRP